MCQISAHQSRDQHNTTYPICNWHVKAMLEKCLTWGQKIVLPKCVLFVHLQLSSWANQIKNVLKSETLIRYIQKMQKCHSTWSNSCEMCWAFLDCCWNWCHIMKLLIFCQHSTYTSHWVWKKRKWNLKLCMNDFLQQNWIMSKSQKG